MIGNIVAVLAVVVIALTVYPAIQDEVTEAQQSQNVTTSMDKVNNTVLGMVVPFFMVAVIGVAIAFVATSLQDAGLSSNDDEDIEPPNSEYSSYEEYVRQRMAVERMLK